MENVEDIYKLSPIQSGMLFHVIKEPESGTYFAQYNCILDGDLDVANFQKAWQFVVQRHAVLRTIFLWDNVKEPLQIVRKQVELPWQIFDWQSLSETEQFTALENHLKADQKQGFDLSHAPLFRFTLIHFSPNNTRLIWSISHLLIDGWSSTFVLNEVLSIYAQLKENKVEQLKQAKPYSEYIAWIQQQNLEAAKAYWKKTLAGFTEPTLLPTDYHTKAGFDTHPGYSREDLILPQKTTEILQELARNNRLTMNTVIQGAWAILLNRYTHQQDVVFGVTVAGRPTELPDVDKRVGLFINTLPTRIKLSPHDSLLNLLNDIQTQQVELREYESTPLVKVQRWSDIPSGQALFKSILVFENYPVIYNERKHLKIKNPEYIEHSNYPLALLIVPDNTNLRLIISYDRSVFGDATIVSFLEHLQNILTSMSKGLDQATAEIDILNQQERQQQLIEWNNTQTNYLENYPTNQSIHHLIEAHNQSSSNAVVTADNQSLSYVELHQRANQLAHYLQSLGVKPNALVGLCVERSIEMLIGILGILKAGGAYVPLDPGYPKQRLATMLSDFANADTVLITVTDLLPNLPECAAQLVCLDNDLGELPTTPPEDQSSADDLAYMIYTSGSTGKPKGVLVRHRNLVHSTLARVHYYPEELNAFLLLSSFAFDSSIAGIFWSLCQGKTLVLPEPDQEKDIEALANLIEKHHVSHTLCVPSLYRMMLDYADPIKLGSLANVIVAGETCSTDLVEQHYQLLPDTALYNEYGPTEATVWSTVARLEPSQPVTIGRPIANTQIYILDEQQHLLPVGVAGELYIAGDGITQGYYKQPELSSKSFVAVPFSSEPDKLCYRTGDLARYQTDGTIEFIGRVDEQIKIHGYRIELGDIESTLKQLQDVLDAKVIAKDDQLLAYVKAESLSLSACETFLAQQLPEYMQPAHITVLNEFPVLPNGKIDLQALPEPEQKILVEGFVAPRNEVEQVLADIWADVLGLDRVSIEDHFLQIGGDSILSIQIIAKARQADLYFTPKDLFERPQISRLAEVVENKSVSQQPQIQTQVAGEIPLTPIQHWFFETIKPVPQHWNQAIQLSLPNTLSPTMAHEVLAYLCQHHDSLRMRFINSSTGWQQFNQVNDYKLPWQVVNLTGLPPHKQEERIEQTADELQHAIDLSSSLVQAAFFQLGEQLENRLLIVIHHLVMDHVSWSILLEDLDHLCRQQIGSEVMQLSVKTTSYRDWSNRLIDMAKSDETTQQLSQWLDFLPKATASLPVDHPDKIIENIERNHIIYTASLDPIQTQALLQEVPKAYQTKTSDVLLAALLQALQQWTGDTSWLIDMELHGREQEGIDLSQTIGWFTSYFPVALHQHDQIEKEKSGALLKSVKEQLRKIPNKGLSYGVLRYLSTQTELNKLPQADILFNYLGQSQRSGATVCKELRHARSGVSRNPDNQRSHLLEINVAISEGMLKTNWSYSCSLYRESTIQDLAQAFITSLQILIEHCQLPDTGGFTPSDFAASGLNQNQLDQFIDNITSND